MKSWQTDRWMRGVASRALAAVRVLPVLLAVQWLVLPARAAAAPSPLVINEIQPQNLTILEDAFGAFGPWLELYNRSSAETVSLDTYCLSTNYGALARWRFPAGWQVGPGAWLVVWADGRPERTRPNALHAAFRLSPERGSVALSRLVNGLAEVVDRVDYDFGVVGPDLSYGLVPDGTAGSRGLMLAPTPGGANRATPIPVRINEWLPGPANGAGWFELFNAGTDRVALGGYWLTDTPNNPARFVIPAGRSLPAKGYLRVWLDNLPSLNAVDPVDLHVNFVAGSGYLGLYAPGGVVVDAIQYGQLPSGTVQGRHPDGAGRIYTGAYGTPRASNVAPPVITRAPQPLAVAEGGEAVFRVAADGTPPLSYRWSRDGVVLAGAAGPELRVGPVKPSDGGVYSVAVFNVAGSVGSSGAGLVVIEVPEVGIEPAGGVVQPGQQVRLRAVGSATPPFTFQWRLNGVNLPGATDDIYDIPDLQVAQGGAYEVIVANAAGAVSSRPAVLTFAFEGPAPQDDFERRAPLSGYSGLISGRNENASLEPGEPLHAGKPGGRSVWYTWRAPATGVATLETRGSALDTVLAVYLGEDFRQLEEIASDDETGGFHTSLVRFNAVRGADYQVAVDGYAGAEGEYVFGWNLDPEAPALPVFERQPASQTVYAGDAVILSVTVTPENAAVEWRRNGQRLPGADGRTLFLEKVTPREVGFYTAVATYGKQMVESRPATIEIGPAGDVQSQDKRADLALNDPLRQFRPAGAGLFSIGGEGIISVSSGPIITHTLSNTTNSVTDLAEASPCGYVTHATRWLDFETEQGGVCLVTAEGVREGGEPFATLVAVYAITNFDQLVLLGCGTNAPGADPVHARVEAVPGGRYLAVVDGINGDQGIITIEWLLGSAPPITQSPAHYEVVEGESLTFGITAPGWSPPPAYYWHRDGAPLPTAHTSGLHWPAVAAVDGGVYSVIVSNVIGQVSNLVATVAVEVPLRVGLSTSGMPPGQASLAGSASQAYRVLRTTDLTCWTPVTVISNVPFALELLVPLGVEPPAEFFRAEPWPVAPWDAAPLCP